MSNPFATPAPPSGGLNFESLAGRLLMVSPHALEDGISTSFGDKQAIRADVVVLDGAAAPDVYDDTLIFPKVLIGQLRSKIGQKVIGRLAQGTAKAGQKPPWILAEGSADDIKVGTAYLSGQLSSPSSGSGSEPPF